MNLAEIRAYQAKVSAQLQEAKAVLAGLEAHAKGQLAQTEIDAIAHLRTMHKEIDKKVHNDLKATSAIAMAAKVKSDIDAEMTKFKALLNQLSAKIKKQPAAV